MRFSSPALLGLTGCDSDFLAAGKKLKEGTAKQVLFDLKSICEWDGTSCVSDVMTEDRVGDYNDYVPGTNSLMIGRSYGFDKYGESRSLRVSLSPPLTCSLRSPLVAGHGDFIKIMGDSGKGDVDNYLMYQAISSSVTLLTLLI